MSERCPGCGAELEPIDGPVHAYMASSPACYAAFNKLLAAEYSDPNLLDVHRLTVDTYAVQHPGSPDDRRCIQSVGLHLARLCVQLERTLLPKETNDAMLGLSKHKASLVHLEPPLGFQVTAADVAPFAGGPEHADKVRDWGARTWDDWSVHHDYVRAWLQEHADL